MFLSDSQTQNGKRTRETSEAFDPVFSFLMDFADKAETIVLPPNAGEMFHELPVEDKEKLLKDLFGEILGNMLDKLPEDGKEAFLVRCFDGLFSKLPYDSQRVIEIKVKDASSPSQEDFATLSAPGSPSAIPNLFPTADLCPVPYKVKRPKVIGNPQPQPQPRPQPPQPRPQPP